MKTNKVSKKDVQKKETTKIVEMSKKDETLKVNKILVEDEVREKIEYSKFNPLILRNINSKKNNINFLWNLFKYFSAIIIGIISIISLYFTNVWGGQFNLLGINFDTINTNIGGLLTITQINTLNDLPLYDVPLSSFTHGDLSTLITLGFLSTFSLIPLLLFKNGTIYSILISVISWGLFIGVIILFSKGVSDQMKLVEDYNSLIALDNTGTSYLAAAKSFLNSLIPGIII